jgi:hypothetical protein
MIHADEVFLIFVEFGSDLAQEPHVLLFHHFAQDLVHGWLRPRSLANNHFLQKCNAYKALQNA